MKKLWFAGMLSVSVFMAAAGVYAESDAETTEEAQVTGEDEEELVMTDDTADFRIQIDDTVYEFPMTYEDFLESGWTPEEDSYELRPNGYTYVLFEKDGSENSRATVYIYNPDINTQPYENCLVAGIDIDSFYWKDEIPVSIASGITYGVSGAEEIEEAYGEPYDLYEGSSYNKYTYQEDTYQETTLYVDLESGVISELTLRNLITPDDFEYTEVSEEIPSLAAAYARPEEMSDDPEDFIFLGDGILYQLPLPVSTLIEDGWELDEDDSDSFIAGRSSGRVVLEKGNQELTCYVRNYDKNATYPQYCFAEELAGALKDSALAVGFRELELFGGISLGMTREAFDEAIANITLDIEESSSSYYDYVEIGEYGASYNFVFDQETNLLVKIEIEKDLDEE